MFNVALYSVQPVLAEGLKVLLSGTYNLSGAYLTTEALKDGVRELHPELILIEVTPSITLEALREVREAYSSGAVVLWVEGISPEFVSQALSIGVRGILCKTAPVDSLYRCLADVAGGSMHIDNELSASLLSSNQVHLTPRERQLMGLVAQGLSNKEVAWSLGISEGTVKVYLSRLFDKTGVGDRYELALLALKNLSPNGASAAARVEGQSVPFQLPSSLVTGSRNAAQKMPVSAAVRPLAHVPAMHGNWVRQ